MCCWLMALAALVSACGFKVTSGSTVQDGPAVDGRDMGDGPIVDGPNGTDALVDSSMPDASGSCVDSTIGATKSHGPSVVTPGTLAPSTSI